MFSCQYIGGGTRGAGGAMAPPDFKIYAFGPPRFQHQKLTNIGWKSLLSMYYSFSSETFRRVFLLEVCADIATWNSKNYPQSQVAHFISPPQVMTCSSTSAVYYIAYFQIIVLQDSRTEVWNLEYGTAIIYGKKLVGMHLLNYNH